MKGGKRSVKTEQDPPTTTLVMSKKKESKVARTKKASELEQRDRAMKGEYPPVKYVEEEET